MIYFIIGLSLFLVKKKFIFFSQIRTFLSLISFESVVLTIFPDFLTKLKCPPSQIATQSVSPKIINLKDAIGVDEKVQQNLSHFNR